MQYGFLFPYQMKKRKAVSEKIIYQARILTDEWGFYCSFNFFSPFKMADLAALGVNKDKNLRLIYTFSLLVQIPF